jgi:hypothetical protein
VGLILLVAAAVVVIALVALAFKAPKPPVEPGNVPSISIRHGLGNSTHTIEHAEQLHRGWNVRLRSGIRSVNILERGPDG